MRIPDEKIIEAYNLATQAGHPDPVGFLARAEIKTGFDYDGEYKGAVGTFGVDKKQAKTAGFDDEELFTTDGNLAAAVTVDMQNLRKAEGDVDEMYRLGNSGANANTDRFIKQLTKEREKLQSSLVFEGGQLTALSRPREEVEHEQSMSKIVQRKSTGIKTPDEIREQTQTFEFQQPDKTRIDDLVTRLVHTIIDEKPINAL